MSRTTYRLTINGEVEASEINQVLEDAGFEIVDISEKAMAGPTKGSTIRDIILREAAKPEDEQVLTRLEVAQEANATVGRVAEIVKEYDDNEQVKAYLERVRLQRSAVRAQKSAELALAKAEEKLAKQKAKAEEASNVQLSEEELEFVESDDNADDEKLVGV